MKRRSHFVTIGNDQYQRMEFFFDGEPESSAWAVISRVDEESIGTRRNRRRIWVVGISVFFLLATSLPLAATIALLTNPEFVFK